MHVQLSGDPRVAVVAPAKQAQAFPQALAKAIVFTLMSAERAAASFGQYEESLRE